MKRVMDFSNCWCEAIAENYNKLMELGTRFTYLAIDYSYSKHKFYNNGQYWSLVEEGFIRTNKSIKQIHLVDGEFHYVEEEMSELDKMKEKYESGDYICVRRNEPTEHEYTFNTESAKKHGFNVVENNWYRVEKIIDYPIFEHKLIHKKHEDILNAYLKDNSVEIYDNTYNELVEPFRFIDSYDKNTDYDLVTEPKEEEMEENSFNKFGFEFNKWCKIYEKTNQAIFGKLYMFNKGDYVCEWDENGKLIYCSCHLALKDDRFNLTPLKKNWWENEEDRGKLIYIDNEHWQGLCIFKHRHDNDITVIYFDGTNGIYNIKDCRPATSEECLSLYIKE